MDASTTPPVCMPNIGARGIVQRRRSGVALLAAASVATVGLVSVAAAPSALLALAPLWVGGGVNWFQAHEKT